MESCKFLRTDNWLCVGRQKSSPKSTVIVGALKLILVTGITDFNETYFFFLLDLAVFAPETFDRLAKKVIPNSTTFSGLDFKSSISKD